jgi:AbrB family looped-hinge helix DNA binding protein
VTTVVKKKTPIVVPESLRRRAGIKPGDRLEFKVSGGIINITAQGPYAEDEYTPAQRRAILTEIAEAQKGPYFGPFDTADEMIASIKTELKKRAPKKKSSKRSR